MFGVKISQNASEKYTYTKNAAWNVKLSGFDHKNIKYISNKRENCG
jgi:hypothetical protein